MPLAEISRRTRSHRSLVLPAIVLLASLAPMAIVQAAPSLHPTQSLWRYRDGSTFDQPRGIAFDPLDGAIYVGNSGQHRIEVFSRTGRALSVFVHRVRGA